MPEGMTRERIKIMESYGAKVHELPLEGGSEGSVAGAEMEISTRVKCLEVERSNPRVWWARQFSNPSNTKAHIKTGREILEQLDGKVDAFVASIGVGGTLYGIASVEGAAARCPDRGRGASLPGILSARVILVFPGQVTKCAAVSSRRCCSAGSLTESRR